MKDARVHHDNWCFKARSYYDDSRVHIEARGLEEGNTSVYISTP